jgi:hypothetical protein
MKHIKAFENYKPTLIYKVGDYIVANWAYNKLCKITGLIPKGHWDYEITALIKPSPTTNFIEDFMDQDQIERYMTKEEILEFETKINSLKYNL